MKKKWWDLYKKDSEISHKPKKIMIGEFSKRHARQLAVTLWSASGTVQLAVNRLTLAELLNVQSAKKKTITKRLQRSMKVIYCKQIENRKTSICLPNIFPVVEINSKFLLLVYSTA